VKEMSHGERGSERASEREREREGGFRVALKSCLAGGCGGAQVRKGDEINRNRAGSHKEGAFKVKSCLPGVDVREGDETKGEGEFRVELKSCLPGVGVPRCE